MTKYNYILLDLDGTMTDSSEGITKSVSYALSKYGISVSSLSDLNCFIGPPINKSFMKYYGFDEKKAEQAILYYRENFTKEGIYQNKLYEGIYSLLEKLKKNGKKLYVATSKPSVFTEIVLKHFNIYEFFDGVCGANLDGSRIEKNEIIKYILDNQIENSKNLLNEIVMVGDTRYDVLGAQNNNINSIAVTYGFGFVEGFENCSPTYMAGSVRELEEILL